MELNAEKIIGALLFAVITMFWIDFRDLKKTLKSTLTDIYGKDGFNERLARIETAHELNHRDDD